MKSLFTITLLVCCVCFKVQAQWYVRPFTGYSLSLNPYSQHQLQYGATERTTSLTHSFGQGLNLGIGVGYTLTSRYSVEVVAHTQLLTERTQSLPYRQGDRWDPSFWYYQPGEHLGIHIDEGSASYHHTLWQVAPLFCIRLPLNDKFTVRWKVGPNFLKMSTYGSYSLFSQQEQRGRHEITVTHKGKVNLGIQGNIGLAYHLSKRLSLEADLVVISNGYHFREFEQRWKYFESNTLIGDARWHYEYPKDKNKVDASSLGLNVGIQYQW